VALTDGLNFGNPETPDVQFQLTESIAGMGRAADAFGIPIVSGNASLYNQSQGTDIFPTPIIGSLGLLEDVEKHVTAGFKSDGDVIIMLGADSAWDDIDGLAGSEYLDLIHGKVEGQPKLDMDLEIRTQAVCRDAIEKGLVKSGHDVSDGGLAVAITESAVIGGIGASITAAPGERWDAAMFGETQSRIIVSATSENLSEIEKLAQVSNVPMVALGTVGGESLSFGDSITLPLADADDAWKNGFSRATDD
jgi:phosphoribosylformylglycinamidine synthase